MAASKFSVPSLSEYQCQICTEILMEPVTLPCRHTLCKTCFESTLEKASLCCPFCRRRISSWARFHTRRNSLVNVELWETIQKHYPEECRRRQASPEQEAETVGEEDIESIRGPSTRGQRSLRTNGRTRPQP